MIGTERAREGLGKIEMHRQDTLVSSRVSRKAELESSEKRWMWTAQNPAAARFDSCAAGLFAPGQADPATLANLGLLHIIHLRRIA